MDTTPSSPGPWQVHAPDWNHTPEIHVLAADSQLVCTLVPWAGRASWPDARLIAAAPELLVRVMRRIDHCIECPARWLGQECGRCEDDRALIERIEGK